MRYEKPKIEVLLFEETHVIRTSLGTEEAVPGSGVNAPDEW